MIFTKPAWGLPESIQKIKACITTKDFDFKTKKEYPIHGFTRLRDVEYFEDLWQTPKLLNELNELIEHNKQEYLNRWQDNQAV
jgi:hypothetical protein